MKATTVLLTLALCLSSLCGTSSGYKILGLFIHPGKSHFDFFRPLLRGLAEAGHEVTVVSYFPNKQPLVNYTDLVLTGMPVVTDSIDLKIFGGDAELIPFKLPMFFKLNEWGMTACNVALNSDIIKGILNSKTKYDVILLEQFNNDCVMAVAHLLQAPVIALSSCSIMPWHYSRMGSPFIPSFMPVSFLPHTDEMGFVERVNNFVHFYVFNFLYNFITQRETNTVIRRHFGASIPPVEDLVRNTNAMLINQHYSLAGAKPYPPSVVELGGMHITEAAPLEPDLQQLLDSSIKGVIYISWGSMIRPESLPVDKREAILKAVERFPQHTILMKWANETIPNQPKNLHTRRWMPQRDILCHPNVKAFITHGGLLGASEATYCGVPMLLTPIYGDQFVNAAAIAKRKLGVVVQYQELKEEIIVKALKTILSPESKMAAKYISESYKNRPEKPLELAMWWVEHIIHTKGAPLTDSALSNMSLFIYLSFDVYLFFAICTLTLILIVKILLKLIMLLLRRNTVNNSKKAKHKTQ